MKIITYCGAFSLLLITSFSSVAQNNNTIKQDAGEKSELYNNRFDAFDLLDLVQQQTGATQANIQLFGEFYQDSLVSDKNKFSLLGVTGPNFNNAAMGLYLNKLVAKYVSLYNTFLDIQKNYPSTVNEYVHRFHGPTLPACSATACDNVGFETETYQISTGCYMQNKSSTTVFSTTAPTCNPLGAVTTGDNDPTTTGQHPSATNQVYLQHGTGTDPISGLKKVCPGAGNYSVMIGDSTIPGSQMAMLETTFPVTAADCDFSYFYSVILQNPGHTLTQQPFLVLPCLIRMATLFPTVATIKLFQVRVLKDLIVLHTAAPKHTIAPGSVHLFRLNII